MTDQMRREGIIHALVAQDRIRAMPSDGGGIDYYVTPKAAATLASVGIKTRLARLPVDEGEHQFGRHVRRIEMHGRTGAIAALGGVEAAQRAFDGVRVVPFTPEFVASYVESLGDAAEIARAGGQVGIRR